MFLSSMLLSETKTVRSIYIPPIYIPPNTVCFFKHLEYYSLCYLTEVFVCSF